MFPRPNIIPRHVRLVPLGFSLFEMLVVLVVLGILVVVAYPRYVNVSRDARTAAIKSLEASVRSSLSIVNSLTNVRGLGSSSAIAGITFINMNGASIRLWNGYPDRWWDGIGMAQAGAQTISGGGYLSTAGIAYNRYTFYGFGNSQIPSGNAGWRIDSAPTPINCSVSYVYNGSGVPTISSVTTGC
jgi:MSHA pilin protein MshA